MRNIIDIEINDIEKSIGGKNEKMKVILRTINDNSNFGNKLQHYATQITLEKLSVKVKSTRFYYSNKLLEDLKNIIRKIIRKRYICFSKFDKKITYSKEYVEKGVKKRKQDADFYIVGSDQVWNTTFPSFNPYYLLQDIPNNKRISFSSSIGTNEIDEKYKALFVAELKKFKAISVREYRGKELVESLTGRQDVEVLVDPTMLLTAEEWDKVSKKPKQLKTDKYILTYFLGELSNQRKTEIERVAKENNCEIINLLDRDSEFYATGPSEFLYLEKHAFLVCTDSFHSSVFSILYNRPFVVFDREGNEKNMSSRIDTLLSTFHLINRRYNGISITKENLEHDYTEAYKILEIERTKSETFLKKALDIKE